MTKSEEIMSRWGRKYLIENTEATEDDIPVGSMISFVDDVESDGFCRTCWSEWDVVTVSFDAFTSNYEGRSGDLLRLIIDEDAG